VPRAALPEGGDATGSGGPHPRPRAVSSLPRAIRRDHSAARTRPRPLRGGDGLPDTRRGIHWGSVISERPRDRAAGPLNSQPPAPFRTTPTQDVAASRRAHALQETVGLFATVRFGLVCPLGHAFPLPNQKTGSTITHHLLAVGRRIRSRMSPGGLVDNLGTTRPFVPRIFRSTTRENWRGPAARALTRRRGFDQDLLDGLSTAIFTAVDRRGLAASDAQIEKGRHRCRALLFGRNVS
jgi:hypothetical protein